MCMALRIDFTYWPIFGRFRPKLSAMIRRARLPDEQLTQTFPGFHVEPTYRKTVLSVVNDSPGWISARLIAVRAGLSYKQTIDVLQVLYNSEKILRNGRKATAKWGPLGLAEPEPQHNYALLESLFNGFARRLK